MELLDTDERQYSIPLWRIVLSIFTLIIVLALSTVVVCGTNEACRSRIPTLGELLDSSLIAPFIVTAMNSVLSLHLFVSAGIHYMVVDDGYIIARVQMAASLIVYGSIVITLFVFPFTSWDRNWANMTIIVALAFWMVTVILCMRKYYRYRANHKRRLVNLQIILCGLYVVWSALYVVFRFFPVSTNLLVTEIGSGVTILCFLFICIVHVWGMELKINVGR
jgi:hypothetical protein